MKNCPWCHSEIRKRMIRNVVEFDKLYLMNLLPGHEFSIHTAIAEITRSDERGNDGNLKYIENKIDAEDGRLVNIDGYPAYPRIKYPGHPKWLDEEGHYENVLDTFYRRLIPSKRDDYNEFLDSIRMSAKNKDKLSRFSFLGYAGARCPNDNYFIVPGLMSIIPPFQLLLPFRYFPVYPNNISNTKIGRKVEFNFINSTYITIFNANGIFEDGSINSNDVLGTVYSCHSEAFWKWNKLGYKITAWVEKVKDYKPYGCNLFVDVTT